MKLKHTFTGKVVDKPASYAMDYDVDCCDAPGQVENLEQQVRVLSMFLGEILDRMPEGQQREIVSKCFYWRPE